MERAPTQFASPEEEIQFLKAEIAKKERELLDRTPEADPGALEHVAKEELKEYVSFTPQSVLEQDHIISPHEMTTAAGKVEVAHNKVEEALQLAEEKGIHNALSVLEKVGDSFVIDEVHRRLIESIKEGKSISELKEGVPPWQVLHMTLFEVTLPELRDNAEQAQAVTQLVALMEQFYAGMQALSQSGKAAHLAIEIAVSDKSDDIVFYVAVPDQAVDLLEKQVLALFPDARLIEQQHDYNIFVDGGASLVATGTLQKPPIYPLRGTEGLEADPLRTLLNAFSKIERDGGGAAVQIIIKPAEERYQAQYRGVIDRVQDGMKPKEAISRLTLGGELFAFAKEVVQTAQNKDHEEKPLSATESEAIEQFRQKVAHPIAQTNIRIAVSAAHEPRAKQILSEIESTFHQYENTAGNKLTFKTLTGVSKAQALKAFSFRQFNQKQSLPLSHGELALLIHFPGEGVDSSPQFKQSRAKTAPAPTEMPMEGTLLGVSKHRNVEKSIYLTAEDRLRHCYIIGQTGTGKTTLMKNMLIQDIARGDGVCFIDPHGTDIEDVLATVPESRRDDVIYFDPSTMDPVIGLNMLEYDESKPEQKTFVVNELFSIFQKLYGAVPESMGPMFEQYFRNATMLVLEDPASGSTLMDISRVMADSAYRRYKLSKATNPVVVQFWQEIATKAGGEASLENIVPYITSKFDVFTANDYMRPIIGQQQSSFNFRQLMDEQKILLVNLSKGRLGDINANLIGMIMVGKILMAALSRVDDSSKGYPPFYLHMDEFQNISTNSISAILSEARKYKLGLTIAHQFIAQLEDDIKDAVFGNVGSMATFRVGPEDSQFLEQQFAPIFEANDLMNVPNHNAYVRLLAFGTPTKPFSLETVAPPQTDPTRVAELRTYSQARYGRPRATVEAEIQTRYQK